MVRRVDELAAEFGAELVVLDPAVPLGLIGPSLGLPYDVVIHGAEVTVPGRLPGAKQTLGHVLRNARHVIAAGRYSLDEANLAAGCELPATVVPPGVDVERFRPLSAPERTAARRHLGLPADAQVIAGVSRLVPRKGFDTAIRAAARMRRTHPDLVLAIAGTGRDANRLRRLADELDAPVTFLGRVDHDDLPLVFGCADVFTMLCRNRWAGLEQEGFGIVFVEAAACGVPQVAGNSGGAAEAVEHEVTGVVVDDPGGDRAVDATVDAFTRLLDDDGLRHRMGVAARGRAVEQFSYDVLSARLGAALGVNP
jgi:phosphatidylinositol alpha-1,6-mannosyltransferase